MTTLDVVQAATNQYLTAMRTVRPDEIDARHLGKRELGELFHQLHQVHNHVVKQLMELVGDLDELAGAAFDIDDYRHDLDTLDDAGDSTLEAAEFLAPGVAN